MNDAEPTASPSAVRLAEQLVHSVQEGAAPGDLTERFAEARRWGDDRATVALREDLDRTLVGLLGPIGPHRLTDIGHPLPAPLVLGERFAQGVALATRMHAAQPRKGTSIPYSAHLLGVASLLLEQPGVTEDQAIAALLHDVIEDQGHQITLAQVELQFGPVVARIVDDCSDTDEDPKPPWHGRKTTYLEHLQGVGRASLQVSLADKVHNATAILRDRRTIGDAVWGRFSAGVEDQRWYYTSLAAVFTGRLGNALSQTLEQTVAELFEDHGATTAPGPARP